MHPPIREYKPCNSLAPFVELYWEGSFNANATGLLVMQMIPNGGLELIIHLNDLHCDLQSNRLWAQSPDYMIVGLYTRPYEVQFTNLVKVFSIRFKPEGIYNVFGVPASVLKERFEDMTMILGKDFRDFCHRLKEEKSTAAMIKRSEKFLLKCVQTNKISMSYVNRAAELIRTTKNIRIEELPHKVFISQRQLEREFKNKVGISPKKYLRIIRINEVLRYMQNNYAMDLTSVAYHCGYFDQSHFINDFKSITGINPSVFIKERENMIRISGLENYAQ